MALCGLLVFGAAGLALIVVWLPVALSAFIRVGTQPVVEWFPTWIQFRARRHSGQTEYRTRLPFQARPSGVMALAGDAAALRFHVDPQTGAAMIEDPHRRTLTAVLAVSHPAFVLLDPSDQDSRVSRWGRLQAHLANSGTVATLQILEALVPDRGDGLQDYYAVYGTHDGGWADQQYAVLLEQTRLGSSTHRTTISLSLDLKAAAAQIKAAGGGIGGAMTVLRGDLAALADQARQAGLTVRGWLGEAELASIIRGAYDPDTTLDPRIDPAANLTGAGPVAISEAWAHFRHDSGWSSVLWIAEWPREDVPPDFLHSLVFVPGVRRTLSLICRPLPSDKARRRIRRARTQALADRHQKQKIGQLTDLSDDQEYADLIAREAAINRGHTDIEFVGLITVTAATLTDLEVGQSPDRPRRRQRRLRRAGAGRPTDPRVRGRGPAARPLPIGGQVPVSDRIPAAANPPESAICPTTVIVDLTTVTSANVRELLSLVEAREARDLQQRCERLARANELLSKPTIGVYRRHTRDVQPPGIDL